MRSDFAKGGEALIHYSTTFETFHRLHRHRSKRCTGLIQEV